MNNNRMEIKERKADLLSKGICFLFVAIIALVIGLLPLVSKLAAQSPIPFYLVGGILFAVFITLFVILIYREFNPKNALVLTASGFTDKNNVGEGIVIQWTNVASVKLLSRRNVSFLGITLENSDIIIAKMKKSLAEEMRENIEENLPSILISQENVRISVNELKEIFIKYIREARVVENGAPTKPKNNPFSTEDVLRAFGKLPADEEHTSEPTNPNEDLSEVEATSIIEQEDEKDIAPTVPEEPFEEPLIVPKAKASTDDSAPSSSEMKEDEKANTSSFDSFYEKLQMKANESAATVTSIDTVIEPAQTQNEITEKYIEPIDATSEDIPDEIKDILNRAKSSKISELGKILNEDTPFTYANPEKAENTLDTVETPEVNHTDKHELEIDNEFSQQPIFNFDIHATDHKISPEIAILDKDTSTDTIVDDDDFEILLPKNLFKETPDEKEELEIKLESISADEIKSSVLPNHDDKTDTKEFYPDLIKINDLSFNEKKNDDDDDFIIPDLIEYK